MQEINNKNYDGLGNDEEVELLNEMCGELCDEYGDGLIGLSELVSVICGKKFYVEYDDEDLEYVKEVMREFCKVNVEFDLENECVYLVSVVDEDEV